MPFKFTKEFEHKLKSQIESELKQGANPIAAFDADGTLWATDMGESFFKFQIENKLVEGLPKDPWNYYVEFHKNQPEAAYLWLAQINKGRRLENVREWAKQCVESHTDLGIFEGQKNLIQHLQSLGVSIFVVTASIKWAVEPAAELFGIPKENVIGIQTKTMNGVISDLQEGPITYKEGKVKGLLEATKGLPPFFASGNSNGDLPLLETATHMKLVVSSAPAESHLSEIEKKMIETARSRNWHHYIF